MNILQFLVLIVQWQINIPAKTTVILQSLKTLVLFEFLPKEEITEFIYSIVGMSEEESRTVEVVDATGNVSGIARTGSSDLVENMNIMLFILIILMAVAILMIFLVFCCKRCPRIHGCFKAILAIIFYNALIRYIF